MPLRSRRPGSIPLDMTTIECELRSFLSKERFEVLRKRLDLEGRHIGTDDQVTHYFDGPNDLRIQKNGSYAKVWLKKGKMHDEAREEIEIRTPKENFEALGELFRTLGYTVTIEWYRTRHTYHWNNVDVMLDYTRGYGHIIELEKLCEPEQQESTVQVLHELLNRLGIEKTPKEEFRKRFDDYRTNWKTLIKEEMTEKDLA